MDEDEGEGEEDKEDKVRENGECTLVIHPSEDA
jgi:hypothetical protein